MHTSSRFRHILNIFHFFIIFLPFLIVIRVEFMEKRGRIKRTTHRPIKTISDVYCIRGLKGRFYGVSRAEQILSIHYWCINTASLRQSFSVYTRFAIDYENDRSHIFYDIEIMEETYSINVLLYNFYIEIIYNQ